MKVQITRVTNRHRRVKASGGTTLDKAHARGFVDGFLVTVNEGKGWDCSCLDDECQHPDAFAAVLHPDMLKVLEGDGEPE